MARLGTARHYSVSLQRWGGLTHYGVLENFVSLDWERALDATGFGEVVIPTPNECCDEVLEQARPMCSEIAIDRDGERVFEGPIYEIDHGPQQTTIRFADLTYLFRWKILQDPYASGLSANFTKVNSEEWGRPQGGADLVDIASSWIQNAFHTGTHNFDLLTEPCGFHGERLPDSHSLWSALRELMDSNIDICALKRDIIIRGQSALQTLPVLTEDSFTGQGFRVLENAQLQMNNIHLESNLEEQISSVSVWNHDALGSGSNGNRPKISPETSACPWVERWVNEGEVGQLTAVDAAKGRMIVNERVIVEAIGSLDADYPAYINSLIPGSVMPFLTSSRRVIAGNLRLSKLSVSYAGGIETIRPTLSPMQADVGV